MKEKIRMPLHIKNTKMFTITCLNMHQKCTIVKSNTTDSTSFELFTCELLFHSLRTICCYIFFLFLVNVAFSLSIYLSPYVCVCRIIKLIEINLPLILLRFFLSVLFFDKLHKQKNTQSIFCSSSV